eukprot:TRINITY_DN2054_c0_g1_i1.p1 TRINITY_DN2054_c0_g1~~TRINITY_DN2054_c0_g1_i1.p1  ORF type:complete len:1010 (-),score=84.61 TRINITY_DN2054_c0_g1_i1:4599-7628(-)
MALYYAAPKYALNVSASVYLNVQPFPFNQFTGNQGSSTNNKRVQEIYAIYVMYIQQSIIKYQMTEYENKLMENFMICGICPNSIWSNFSMQSEIGNLLTNELADHRLDVLFSYPEPEERQSTVLDVLYKGSYLGEQYIFPESFKIKETKPNETQLERYMITNEYGETFYVYCKVLYEEITEEFLSNNYYIKKALPKRESKADLLGSFLRSGNGTPKRRSINSESEALEKQGAASMKRAEKSSVTSEKPEYGSPILPKPSLKREVSFSANRCKQGLRDNAEEEKKGPFPRRSSIMVSFDEMDISGTAYSKFTKKVRKRSGAVDQSRAMVAGILNVHKSYYVPLALCIKTKTSDHEFAEQLLLALINLLYTDPNAYRIDLQNLIYSYSEFLSHTMLLTHITSPPPLTQYTLALGTTEVAYTEGSLAELPCENDISVAHLFSLLDSDCVIALWTALLLDIRIIVYTPNINECFFIIKALNQLMFPFKWHHSKGIAPSLSLLFQPPPYCYGVMKSVFPNKYEITNGLCDEHFPHILLDVESLAIHIFPREDFVVFPKDNFLKQELLKLTKHYNIERTGLIESPESKHVEFSKQVRQLFLSELIPYVKSMSIVCRKAKTDDFYTFAEAYLKHFMEKQPKPKDDEVKFMKNLVESQCFAVLFDEVYEEEQKNFARLEAMKKRGKVTCNEFTKIAISSPQSVVISRVSKLAEVASKEKCKPRLKTDEASDRILLKMKVNWIDEIFKMQGLFMKQQPKTVKKPVFGSKKHSGMVQSVSSDASSGNRTILNDKQQEHFDIGIEIEEQKTSCVMMYGVSVMNPPSYSNYMEQKIPWRKRPRKGPFFYGPMGILSFCQELFCVGKGKKNTLNLFEDIKASIEKAKGSSTKVNSTNSANDAQVAPIMCRSKDDGYLEESGSPQVHITSPLLEALIEPKELYKRSIGGKIEDPFIAFSSTTNCQFYVFCAIYYSKYQQHPYEIVKVVLRQQQNIYSFIWKRISSCSRHKFIRRICHCSTSRG